MRRPVGQRIRELREARGIKQNALARFSGISVTAMYQIEHGEITPSLATLERIADALHTEPAELLREPAPLAEPAGKDPAAAWLEENLGHAYIALTPSELSDRIERDPDGEEIAEAVVEECEAVQEEGGRVKSMFQHLDPGTAHSIALVSRGIRRKREKEQAEKDEGKVDEALEDRSELEELEEIRKSVLAGARHS